MMKKSNRWLWAGMIMLFVALLTAGCHSQGGSGGGGGDGVEPGVPAQITLSAINMSVAIDGLITITATVTDSDGNDVADSTVVTLSLNSGSGAVTITPSSQQTIKGRATFIVTGTTAGIVNLIAQAGGAIATITITVVDTAPQITIAADLTTVSVGGTTTITATVAERNGAPVPDGTEITFVLSDSTIADLSELYPQTVDGVATVIFTAKQAGTVDVGAVYGTGTGMLTMTVTEQVVGPAASINLTSSAGTVQVGRTATLTAVVRDASNQLVADGTSVTFSVDSDAGTISPLSAVTSAGRATTTFTAVKYGQAVITAKAGNITATTTINVTANVTYLSIATSKTAVNTDNRDSARITATALDGNRAPVAGVPITFSATAGQISAATVNTDAKGEASMLFTSGAYDKENQTVTITASAPPNQTASIPIQLTGTTVTVTINNTSLQGLPVPTSTTLTATVKDGGGIAIFDADVTITQATDGTASILLKQAGAAGAGTATLTGATDVTGKFVVTVTGNNAGILPVTLTTTAMGATATKDVTVSGQAFELLAGTSVVAGPGNAFAFNNNGLNPDTITRSDAGGSFLVDGFSSSDVIRVTGAGTAANNGIFDVTAVTATTLTLAITAALTTEAAGAVVTITKLSSDESVISADTSSLVNLWVRSPNGNNVRISTTVGTLTSPTFVSGNGTAVLTASPDPATNIVTVGLTTPAFAAVATLLAEDATSASVNDSLRVAIAAPSATAAKISIQASPTVIPVSSGDVVNVSSLLITVRNATDEVVGGAPVLLSLTDTTGGGEYISPTLVYTDMFGQAEATLYAGSLVSDSQGILCVAEIVGTGITDDIRVVIGGTASSVSIGRPTHYFVESESVYRIPFSVLVADSNGNPVNGATVNLSLWPLGYYTGHILTNYCCDSYYPNEDVNRNEILDAGEDVNPYPANGNGVLDPAKSAAGTVPATVITDENGVAEFDVYQQKIYRTYTKTEIKASVVVYGSETIAILQYAPSCLASEINNFPSSPWDNDCFDPFGVLWPCP